VLKKRSVTLLGHSTSVALEAEFWEALEARARAEQSTLAILIGRIDEGRDGKPLASACRLAALRWAQASTSAERREPGQAPA
jgi:predicted DNA-binding ribbon-helix-helix protein